MARKNIEVTIAGGLSSKVPSAPVVETPVAPQAEAVPELIIEKEETKPSQPTSKKGKGRG